MRKRFRFESCNHNKEIPHRLCLKECDDLALLMTFIVAANCWRMQLWGNNIDEFELVYGSYLPM